MIVAKNISKIKAEGALVTLQRAQQLQKMGHDVINLGIGQPDFSPPDFVREQASQSVLQGPHGYTSMLGITELRSAIAEKINKQHSLSLDLEQIAIMPGSKMTLSFAVFMFAAEDAEILYPDPGFPPYRSTIAYSGSTPVPYPLSAGGENSNAFDLDADAILSRITPQTRLIIINTPGNPTGGGATATELEKLCNGLLDYPDVAILSDEIYAEISYETPHLSLLSYPQIRERLIVLDGWSKSHAMTGWRIGYGVWPQSLIEPLEKLVMVHHSCTNVAAQFGALAATTGDNQAVQDMVKIYQQRRDFLVDALNALPGVTCPKPNGAFYLFPDIRGTGLDDRDFAEGLLEQAHVGVLAGSDFGVNGQGHLRFSYAADLAKLEVAMQRIQRFLAA